MSIVHLLAYDFSLPEIDMRVFKEKIAGKSTIGFVQGFSVSNCYWSKDDIEVSNFITGQYLYDVDLTEEDSCIENFKNYLFRYMKPNSEIELWSIWLGGDDSKHYTIMPRLNNVPSEDVSMVNDEIGYFAEHYFKPVKRGIELSLLSKKDILFVLENTGVCLIIKN
ncbi:hypothetical protein DW1_0527 [Proteiniborus sp. DW1]|uniref:hypothetical protein n=1 Tax=Proteiniborus sp. DW1 TaxID=1889883 RepID=UPI00092E16C7|nr:hypothetical protein [Proteiniborus sp. DW1]SCG82138.1 hypothetical protein DW1_0527 [Proteiniborus sp. DW1]